MADSPRLPWFRVYSEILDDRKIERVCKMTSEPKALIIGVWISLLALANDSPERGRLCVTTEIPITMGDLCDETGLSQEFLSPIIDAFHDLGMLNGDETMAIKNWDKRQFKSDSSAERVRRYRENVTVGGSPDVALQKRYSNALDTDTESDTDKEEEEEGKPAQNIFALYEQNIGLLTPMLAEKLKDAEEDYPPEWIPEAFKIAIENNARNWAYVKAILERWKVDGFKSDTRPRKNGKPPPVNEPAGFAGIRAFLEDQKNGDQ